MTRIARSAALLALLGVMAMTPLARAQYYPKGYGGYGWGGWGHGRAGTGAGVGAAAYGMGNYASGAGQYNVETAQARATNVQTAEGLNNYMYEVNSRNAKTYYDQLAKQQGKDEAAWKEIHQRILDNPTEADVNKGDALNAILQVITSPKVYGRALAAASQTLPGPVVSQIPFAYNAAGFTYSLGELIDREDIPAVFSRPEFAEPRRALRPIAAELRKEADVEGQPKAATLKRFRAELAKVKAALEVATTQDTPERDEGEHYVKALYGLSKMLESPSYDVYLAAAGKEKAVPLRDILQFMHAFGLKFGVAKTQADKEIYAQLYGTLSDVRQATNPPAENFVAAATSPPQSDQRVTNFYGGMQYGNVQPPPAQDLP